MNQSPRTIQQQIAILKSRGMAFSDENLATSYLTRISYFRLKYYWTDMIDVATGHFSDDASFDTVIQRYEFDKRLRSILFAAIEILEVGLRTKFITTLSLATNSRLWYLDSSLFDNRQYHESVVLDIKTEFGRNSDPFVRKYIDEHPNWDKNSLSGDNPDTWMIFETATFGTLSKMYKNLKNQSPLKSRISCLLYLCNAIKPDNTVKDDIKDLFCSMPNVPVFMIGFTRGWDNNPLWK